MRPVLLIVAAVAVFFVWDNVRNGGDYSAMLKSRLMQAEDFPGMVKISVD